jgi:rRNA maturation endonuclease Nob1
MKWQFPPDTVYQVMTEQPDTCHRCGSRLMLLDITKIDNQRVFVCDCLECQRIIPIVEDDVTALDD